MTGRCFAPLLAERLEREDAERQAAQLEASGFREGRACVRLLSPGLCLRPWPAVCQCCRSADTASRQKRFRSTPLVFAAKCGQLGRPAVYLQGELQEAREQLVAATAAASANSQAATAEAATRKWQAEADAAARCRHIKSPPLPRGIRLPHAFLLASLLLW